MTLAFTLYVVGFVNTMMSGMLSDRENDEPTHWIPLLISSTIWPLGFLFLTYEWIKG